MIQWDITLVLPSKEYILLGNKRCHKGGMGQVSTKAQRMCSIVPANGDRIHCVLASDAAERHSWVDEGFVV